MKNNYEANQEKLWNAIDLLGLNKTQASRLLQIDRTLLWAYLSDKNAKRHKNITDSKLEYFLWRLSTAKKIADEQ